MVRCVEAKPKYCHMIVPGWNLEYRLDLRRRRGFQWVWRCHPAESHIAHVRMVLGMHNAFSPPRKIRKLGVRLG